MYTILDKCDIMRIGLCVDNELYVVPLNFAYEVIDEEAFIYFHCAWSAEFESVIGEGKMAGKLKA